MPGISTTGLPATLFLAGPTGSGKSAVAVELAEMLGAEIVGSDAYQVYRELPILTAAPSPEGAGNGLEHGGRGARPARGGDAVWSDCLTPQEQSALKEIFR